MPNPPETTTTKYETIEKIGGICKVHQQTITFDGKASGLICYYKD